MRLPAHGLGIDASTISSASAAEASTNVDFQWGVKIPMRDGVSLNATVYRPKNAAPLPVIFTMTPYIADSYHDRAFYFAQHGYVYVLVDCRGRGSSEGRFLPFVHDARDAHDVVEWLAAQSWCAGAVTMWGGSYAGYNQWAALKENPSHLKTIVPAAAAQAGVDFPFFKNILTTYEIQWLTFTSGATGNARLFAEDVFWIAKFREWYLNHRPFRELDQIVGNLTTEFQTWIAHPTPDSYWDALVLSSDEFDRINLPILTITGHYDGDQPGALCAYQRHMQSSSPSRDQHYLIVGAWDHPGTRTPQREFGGLKFGEASLVDLNKLHVEWYDWTIKGGAKPEFLKKRVAYYLAGADEWKYADSLETISNGSRRLYLGSDNGAKDVFHSGSLSDSQSDGQPSDSYTYDPLDTRNEVLEREAFTDIYTDQRYVLHTSGDGLIYHSAPFEQALEITGVLRLVLWMALDVPDTDFQVTVYEILADGSSIWLTQDWLRARYRESLRQEKLIEAGAIHPYTFDTFFFFSRQIAKGSRLRLFITSPNSIYLQKNYNGGGVVAGESGADARTAHITVYHDAEHPSYLDLPIVK